MECRPEIKLEFCVTVWCDRKPIEEDEVYVAVTDEEYHLLKECCRNNKDMNAFEGLESLNVRIVEQLRADFAAIEREEDEEVPDIDYEAADYTIEIPDVIYDEIRTDDK